MNEPPPPYYMTSGPGGWCVAELTEDDDGEFVNIVGSYSDQSMALIIRDHRNAAYMHGWRDRDEQEGKNET
jgi:hypothetical protein